jgi:hypothetical protein
MAQEEKIDRKPQASPIKGVSLYASSADYERRLSEDCGQPVQPNFVNEPPADDA